MIILFRPPVLRSFISDVLKCPYFMGVLHILLRIWCAPFYFFLLVLLLDVCQTFLLCTPNISFFHIFYLFLSLTCVMDCFLKSIFQFILYLAVFSLPFNLSTDYFSYFLLFLKLLFGVLSHLSALFTHYSVSVLNYDRL